MSLQESNNPVNPQPAVPAVAYRPPQMHPFFDDLDAATPRSIMVPALIVINIAVFVAMIASGISIIMPDASSTLPWGVDFWPYTTGGQWWRLLTSAFIHFGIIHIGFNMWALYAVGKFTERLFGNVFFLVIYLLCAVLSGITSIWFEQKAAAAGASGAIFGIYGALLAYLVLQRAVFPQGAVKNLMRSALGFVAFNIVFGFTVPGISNGAHLGGLVTGFILGAVFARPLDRVRRKQQTLPKFIAGVVLGVAMIVAGIAFVPKAPPALVAHIKFINAVSRLEVDRKKAEKNYADLLDQLHAGQLQPADAADRLEKSIVPAWSKICDQLQAMEVRHDPVDGTLYEAAFNYARLTRDAAKALDAALRHPDEKTIETSNQLSIQRAHMREQLEQLQTSLEDSK